MNAELMTTIGEKLTDSEVDHSAIIDDGGYWIRIDVDEFTTNSEDEWDYVREALYGVGLEIDDVQIEHDCISGRVILIED